MILIVKVKESMVIILGTFQLVEHYYVLRKEIRNLLYSKPPNKQTITITSLYTYNYDY
jgi:hypothetical protein